MDILDRAETKLRYRFSSLQQAKAHLKQVQGRALFFYRDEKIRPLTGAPVCLELHFEEDEPSRILHGVAVAQVEGLGCWLELQDTRPLRELMPIEYTRHSQRMGCDLFVEVSAPGLTVTGRMLDLSAGGARIRGVTGLGENEHVEVRLLSEDRLTFHDLSGAFVAWTRGNEVGVCFDRLDAINRIAVAKLVAHTERDWVRSFLSAHPAGCCGASGLIGPEAPELLPSQMAESARA